MITWYHKRRPLCRNNWHTHPSNQILIVKEGECWYQEEGKPVQHVAVGAVINVLPGVRHWHGASPDNHMVHIAININTDKGVVNWLEPVQTKSIANDKKTIWPNSIFNHIINSTKEMNTM